MDNAAETFITVGAQFYDLMQRDLMLRRAERVVAEVSAPAESLLDLGAGTGVIPMALADAWPGVHLHAVEPSRAMRTALLTSLAARPDLLERTTVHPRQLPDTTLVDCSDLVTSFWVMHAINEPDWTRTLDAVVRALRPGGRFLVETPLDDAGPRVNEWSGDFALGPHTLTYTSRFEHRADGSMDGNFSYTWRDENGQVLYADADHSHHGPQPPRQLGTALAARGFSEEHRFADASLRGTGATLSIFRLGPTKGISPLTQITGGIHDHEYSSAFPDDQGPRQGTTKHLDPLGAGWPTFP